VERVLTAAAAAAARGKSARRRIPAGMIKGSYFKKKNFSSGGKVERKKMSQIYFKKKNKSYVEGKVYLQRYIWLWKLLWADGTVFSHRVFHKYARCKHNTFHQSATTSNHQQPATGRTT
jgi:hypothetical protein